MMTSEQEEEAFEKGFEEGAKAAIACLFDNTKNKIWDDFATYKVKSMLAARKDGQKAKRGV